MSWFYNLKIARKLMLVFALVVAMACGLGVFSISQLVKVRDASNDIATNWLPSVRYLGQVQASLSRYRISEATHVLLPDEADMLATDKSMATRLETLRKQQESYAALVTEPEETRLYKELTVALDDYLVESKKVTALSHAGKKDEARAAFRGPSNKLFRQINEALDAIIKINDSGSAASAASAMQTYQMARKLIIGSLVALALIGLLLAVGLARIVARPLQEAVAIAGRVAGGDLSGVIVSSSSDETGQLMASLRSMNDSLLGVVQQVRSGTDTIALASAEIASGNLDLSSRTEEQASSLEETASAMEELTATVRQNADNARQANQLALSASTIASDGGAVVNDVISTMESISASSRKIVDIISVIDGIAFQTNILALNAAVEAARAGEQGRGFAVVASEVRNLAQRSAAAAKEIKQLIDNSVFQVDAGTALVQRAGSTMTEVVVSVRRVSDVVAEISAASHEQSSGIDEVNKAIVQMDEVTQQNAALVEQAAAAAGALQEQADHLARVVSVFRLDSAGAPAAGRPGARAVALRPSAARAVH
ncbi:MCP four helix bundle domain-containing protein [Massilia violaceinigra]|uniref:MCP four helix bundle domain-containing protein n=1 Tax=Massilia violaceinigra TaxID=2045208 RepID=A0ABY4A4Z2_9BURK|nr:methyl-accepting chemotaxis protein [Massilia violaceinigra]UOD29845.1 MCP four helix bundle domain-containing protein [Massilia violaceinigra]